MSVLVVVASRHGATQEIADAIGVVISGGGFTVDVVNLTELANAGSGPNPAEYEAVVLGSGVYLGRWLSPAREFITQNWETLRRMPVWAFSSGPVGVQHGGTERHESVAGVAAALDLRGYKVFAGKIDRRNLGLLERLVVSAIRAGDEDDRDWDDVASWAGEIVAALRVGAASTS